MRKWMGGLVLAAISLTTVQLNADQRVRRYYDRDARDYHEWNEHEGRAYRRYMEERREKYREYARLKREQQRAYWRWRHAHRD
jgi:hypothetical protein